MSKLRFRVFILLTIFILPIFCNAEVKNVSTTGTLIKGSYEEIILNLVNSARREAGVSELKLDTRLTNAARQRAVELGSYYNGNHLRPTLNRFNEVYQEFGINYTAASENIAYGHGISDYTTAEGVFNVWMNSTLHRNNILSSKYTALGIGIYKAPNGFYYWVQDFSNSTYSEYTPTNSYTEDYGSYTLKYEDTIYPNVELSNISDISMNVSDTKTLDYYITSINTGTYNNSEVRLKLLDWHSSNPDVISVSRNNDIVTLTAKSPGSSIISTTYAGKTVSFIVNVEGQTNDYYVLYNVNNNSRDSRIDISNSQELSTLILETEISKNIRTEFYSNGDYVSKSNINVTYCHNDTCIKPIKYETNNELIADYIQNEFIFNNSGQTTITAIFENGLKVKIPVQVSLLKFNENEYSIIASETKKTRIITDLDGSFSYKSLNPEIATIDSNGVITGISIGDSIIECSNDKGFKTYAKVHVVNKEEVSINIDEYNIEFVEGGKGIIKYSVIPQNVKVSFKSSNEDIVQVNQDGTLIGLKSGHATIYVTVTIDNESIVKEVSVNVLKKEIPVTDIIVDKTNISLNIGEFALINASVIPLDAIDKSLTYKSSDEMIAVVDGNGKITAINSGDAVITVTAGNGVSKSIAVSVKEKALESPILEVDKTNVLLSIGMQEELNIKVVPDRIVTIVSDDPSIATVDGKVITAIKNGSTIIHITTDLGDEVLVHVQVQDNPITDIILDHDDITLAEGESININATIYPNNTTDSLDLGWMSNNIDVATVDNGKITAIKEGTTTVIVSSVNGVQSLIKVNVIKKRIPISNILVDKDNIELFIDDTITINANVYPLDTTDSKSLTWKSSDSLIALVDNNGKITAVHEGNVVITVTTSNGISHEIRVLVKKNSIPITDINVDKKIIELEEGELTSINVQINPSDTTLSKKLTWESNDSFVATVSDDGVITAIKSGRCLITVTSVNGISDTVEVIVKAKSIPISSINLGKDKIALYVGQNYKLNAIIYPINTTDDKTLSWKSSNSDILKVDSNGLITAINTGRSIITVTSINGITAQVIVDVLDEEIKEIHLNKHDIELTDNNEKLEIESILPVDSNLDYNLIEWSSSNPNVAIIYNNRIIPVGYGETYITARYGDVSDTCRIVVPTTYKNTIVGQLYDSVKKYDNNENVDVLANEKDILGINLNPDIQILLELYDTFQISWESTDNSILDVINGNVRFLKAGSASIIVSFGMYSTTLNYNVYNIETSVSSKKIHVGDTTTINTEITTPTTIDKNYYYTISDSNIISIKDGVITGLNPGIVTIYVYSSNGLYKSIMLEVESKQVVSNHFDVVFDRNIVELENDNGKVVLQLKNNINNIPNGLNNLLSDNEDILSYYNISYIEGNDELFTDAVYNVSIPVEFDLSKYSSIYVLYELDGNVSIIPSEYNDGYIKFETNHIGNYIIAGILKEKELNNTGNIELDNPETGNNIVTYIVSWIMAFLALGLLVITSVIKKRMN